MKKLMVMVFAAVVAVVGYGDTIALELTGDCTFAEALAAYNTAHSTSYVDSDGGTSLGANEVEVSGTGVMTMSAKSLGSWTGNLTIKSGATVLGNATTDIYADILGSTTSGQVTVEDGASLQLSTEAGSNDKKVARPIYIAGTGVNNKGALQVRGISNLRAPFPKKIYLTADAQISRLGTNGQSTFVPNSSTAFYLQNHALTFKKTDATFSQIFEDPVIVPGGDDAKIIADVGTLFYIRSSSNWGAGNGNLFKVMDGTSVQPQATFGSSGWRLDWDTTNGLNLNWNDKITEQPEYMDDTGDKRCWRGPVTLTRSFYGSDTHPCVQQTGFKGKVSGSGSIVMYSANHTNHFHLVSGENDFTGSIGMTNCMLRVGAPTAVPSCASAMMLKGSEIDLNYAQTAGEFVFPATTVDGAGKVFSKVKSDSLLHAGKFASLTKKGAGELDIQARLTGGALTVQGGTVKLAKPLTEDEQCAAFAGVWFGQKGNITGENPFKQSAEKDIGWGNKPLKDVAPYIVYSNSTINALTIFNHPHGEYGPGNNTWYDSFLDKLTVYSGYLWNKSSEAKTIKVICTLNAYVRLTIGDHATIESVEPRRCITTTPYSPSINTTVTLQPGINKFDVRVIDRYGYSSWDYEKDSGHQMFCYGNICTNGLSNWDDTHGLVWTDAANQNSVDLDDYHRFDESSAQDLEFLKLPQFETTYQQLDTLGGSGKVDLNGGTLKLGTVTPENIGNVVNGTLITDNPILVSDNTTGIDIGQCLGNVTVNVEQGAKVKVDVDQDAEARRAACVGVWDGRTEDAKKEGTISGWDPFTQSTEKDIGWGKKPLKDVLPYIVYSNKTSKALAIFKHPHGEYGAGNYEWSDQFLNRVTIYSGYLWNNSTEAKTIKVICTLNAYVWLTVGDNKTIKSSYPEREMRYTKNDNGEIVFGEPYNPRGSWTITLQPGANKFDVRAYDQYGLSYYDYIKGTTQMFCYGNICTNGLSNWDDTHGLVWSENLSSTDLNDFHDFVDDGDGYTLTTAASAVPFIKSSGHEVDLGEKETATGMLIGDVQASNGTLVVDGVWKLTRAEVEDSVVSTGLAFTKSSRIEITDATMTAIYNDMSTSGKINVGYVLATGVVGNIRPKLVSAADDKRMSLVLDKGTLTLLPGLGTLIIAK